MVFALFLVTALFWPPGESRAAGLTTGHTWTNGEVMTHTKLNQMVNEGTVTNITTGDISDLANTLAKQAADSVNSSKIVNLSIVGGVGGDIAYGTIESTNILAATFNGREFGTTLSFTNATTALNFNTNQILAPYVQGTNAFVGASHAGYVPKLNANGKIDPTLYYAPTNQVTTLAANTAAAGTYSTLASATTSATNGTVFVIGQAIFDDTGTGGAVVAIRITDGTGAMLAGAADGRTASDPKTVSLTCFAVDTLTGATKTYNLQGVAAGAAAGRNWMMTGQSAQQAYAGLTNGTRIAVIEIPRL